MRWKNKVATVYFLFSRRYKHSMYYLWKNRNVFPLYTIQRFSFRQIKLLPLIYDEWHKPLCTVHIIQVASGAVFENESARPATTKIDEKKMSHRPIIHIINLVASMPSIFPFISHHPKADCCRAWYCTVILHCYYMLSHNSFDKTRNKITN